MKPKLLLFFLFLISHCLVAQNKGAIRGTVTTSEGQPAPYVNVSLKGTTKGASTNNAGVFEIRNIEAGTYILTTSFIGLATKELTVEVVAGKTISLSEIILTENAQQLNEIVISDSRSNPYAREESEFVSKLPLNKMENSQVYSTITKELLVDQLVFSVDDAVKNAPGITKMWEATGRSGDGGSYYNSRGFIVQSKLRNGIAGNVSSQIDAINLESIEVVKGPSGTLFGNNLTSYGGLINRVTKKPYNKFGGEVTYAGGNFGFNRISADVNTPLNRSNNILFRLNTAYQYEGSFQDNGFGKGLAIAPSLSFKPTERLSVLVDAEIYRGQNTGLSVFFFPWGQTIASLGASSADELNIDYKRAYSSNDLYQKSRNTNMFAQIDYKISDRWRSQTNVTSTNSFSDGPSPYFYLLSDAAITGDPNDIGNGYISRNDQFTDNSKDRIIEIQQNFIGNFEIGGLKNRFVAGLDFFHQNSDQFFSGGTLDTVYALGNIPNYDNFNRETMDELYRNGGTNFTFQSIFKTNTYSAYVSDVLNLTDNLMVLAALRVDHFDNNGSYNRGSEEVIDNSAFSQTFLSPKFGIVFQPLKDKVAVFANYQNGFTNKTGADASGKTFKPEQANQIEGGLKLDLLEGKLTSTLSYYHISVENMLRPDPAVPSFSIQNGTQVSKGVEVELIANPLQGLSVVAGFAYNDSEMTKAEPNYEGRRPETAGSPYAGNLWLSYRIPAGKLNGLGIGFGGNYTSDNKIINSASTGTFILPAYTVLNATAFYDHNKFRIGVKVDNLTDEHYWIGYTTVNPQKLRSFTGSITYKF